MPFGREMQAWFVGSTRFLLVFVIINSLSIF